MKKIKKALRLLALVLFVVLASFGLGFAGALLPASKEPYQHKRTRIEQVDKKEEESEKD
jgi:hypothetical protein